MPLFVTTRILGEPGVLLVPEGQVLEAELTAEMIIEITYPSNVNQHQRRIHVQPAVFTSNWAPGLVPYQEDWQSLAVQVNRLAEFITGHVPGEPSQNQGAIDTAIRVMQTLLDLHHIPPPQKPIDSTGFPTVWERLKDDSPHG